MAEKEKGRNFLVKDGKLYKCVIKPVETEKCPLCNEDVLVGKKNCPNCGTNMMAVRSGT
jgi:hypothetical protein